MVSLYFSQSAHQASHTHTQHDHRNRDDRLNALADSRPVPSLSQQFHHPVQSQSGHHRNDRGYQEYGSDHLRPSRADLSAHGAEQRAAENRQVIRDPKVRHYPIQQIGQACNQPGKKPGFPWGVNQHRETESSEESAEKRAISQRLAELED